MFLEISQSSQENTCVRVSFLIKLKSSGLRLYLKRDSGTGVSCEFCEDFKNTFFTVHLRATLLYRKVVYSVLSKYVEDNITQENYLCNIGPDRAAMILKENNLYNFVLVCLGQDCTKQ